MLFGQSGEVNSFSRALSKYFLAKDGSAPPREIGLYADTDRQTDRQTD